MRTLNIKSRLIILLTLTISLSGCLSKEDINLPYNGFSPEFTGDGWEISTPEAENINQVLIEQVYKDFYNGAKYPTIQSLLIIRNNKLVAEAYCKNLNDRYQLHNMMSVTKSITSILTGIALDKNLIDSIDTPVYNYLSAYFDEDYRKKSITIRQVLMMETGLEFDNNKHSRELISEKGSSLEYVLHKELKFIPETDWYYGDGNPQLISGIIQQITGKTLAEFANEHLFEPLGIIDYQWEVLSDKLNIGAQGLWLTPRDMGKIGLLMANNGWWKGESLLAENWVNVSTKRQSSHQNYGYYWHPIEDKAYYAEGHGGQLIWVYPEKELVIIITSDPHAKTWYLSESYDNIFNQILKSIED